MDQAGIAIDIDETLANTNLFWAMHLVKLFGAPDGLSAETIMAQYHYCRSVPFWGYEEMEWVDANRLSPEIMLQTPTVPGAVQAVLNVERTVPVLAYITSRPESTVPVTREWLHKNGFPSAPVMACPEINNASAEYAWKASAIESMFPRVWCMVDDNPEVLSALSDSYRGVFFLYGNEVRGSTSVSYIQCADWHDMQEAICREAVKHWG